MCSVVTSVASWAVLLGFLSVVNWVALTVDRWASSRAARWDLSAGSRVGTLDGHLVEMKVGMTAVARAVQSVFCWAGQTGVRMVVLMGDLTVDRKERNWAERRADLKAEHWAPMTADQTVVMWVASTAMTKVALMAVEMAVQWEKSRAVTTVSVTVDCWAKRMAVLRAASKAVLRVA